MKMKKKIINNYDGSINLFYDFENEGFVTLNEAAVILMPLKLIVATCYGCLKEKFYSVHDCIDLVCLFLRIQYKFDIFIKAKISRIATCRPNQKLKLAKDVNYCFGCYDRFSNSFILILVIHLLFIMFLKICISLLLVYIIVPTSSTFDDNGYLLYCPCMGTSVMKMILVILFTDNTIVFN